MSAPPSPRPTKSKSAPATVRCIIFISGGKSRCGATEGATEPLHFRDVRGQEKNCNAEISRATGGRGHARRRGLVAAAVRSGGGGATGAGLRQRGRSGNHPCLDAEIPCSAQGRRRGCDQGG